MSSKDWEYFMENYFGDPYMMWHDGIDTKSVIRLKGEERTKAEGMLIGAMKSGSYWGAIGLRELRSEKAVPHLKEMLPQATEMLKIHVAIALCVIEESTEYVGNIIEVLENDSEYFRLEAALSLKHFPIPEVIDALFRAVIDPEYLVRYHVCDSILHIYGIEDSIDQFEDIFAHIGIEYDPESEASINLAIEHYETASKMLKELVESKGKVRALTFDF